jgi:hypothetical protein
MRRDRSDTDSEYNKRPIKKIVKEILKILKEDESQSSPIQEISKDILSVLIFKSGLTVEDINNLCNSAPILARLCSKNDVWERIYEKLVPEDKLKWGNYPNMPNLYIRFLVLYYEYKTRSDPETSFEVCKGSEVIRFFAHSRPIIKTPFRFGVDPDYHIVANRPILDRLYYFLLNGWTVTYPTIDVKSTVILCKICSIPAIGKCCQDTAYCGKDCQAQDIEHLNESHI